MNVALDEYRSFICFALIMHKILEKFRAKNGVYIPILRVSSCSRGFLAFLLVTFSQAN